MDVDEVTELERGYEASHRIYELAGMSASASAAVWLLARLLDAPIPAWWIPPALGLGMLGADLVSGMVHWAFDTWGDLDTPVVGKLAIRAFRQHHLDPTKMLEHDFVETNGHNFFLALPVLLGGLGFSAQGNTRPAFAFAALALFLMAVFVAFTSQIHKWAHTPRPPRLVGLLQRAHLLLPPAHHIAHHTAPHVDNYCITVGWLDSLLRASRVFARAERSIERLTGHRPTTRRGEPASR